MIPQLAVNVAIFDDDRLVLMQREDFEVWCLPGGQVEDGESLAEAAVREVREETGLDVALTGLVGTYSRPLWHGGIHVVLFAARLVGGTLTPDPVEVIDLGWFPTPPCHPRSSAGSGNGSRMRSRAGAASLARVAFAPRSPRGRRRIGVATSRAWRAPRSTRLTSRTTSTRKRSRSGSERFSIGVANHRLAR